MSSDRQWSPSWKTVCHLTFKIVFLVTIPPARIWNRFLALVEQLFILSYKSKLMLTYYVKFIPRVASKFYFKSVSFTVLPKVTFHVCGEETTYYGCIPLQLYTLFIWSFFHMGYTFDVFTIER